ncbi:2-amino-4-hydroxy-6-hydroxymethyldihydropteridine diphosphokinase [Bacteroides sp. ET71]|uniref:2-amino-4-hydroxy-6- hydroxymethyldihydropteridine diphosphokinase n=1 Tax=Bacteroides sp. ET71 TaxID=2939421 RepID=UPI0020136253|nr:2-amino-4-hydroxy-6-hydroxymethyldihydropteridine diphosphokinase [Bacteroides sp. ET71]MCL1616273.1 2-amino-4-hydroxy-6-hydroxymethyldihydropteridine diphosphokinase [Bacteroides sp. ET71]
MVYTVCIGSNEHPQANLAFARRRLSECFPGIRFSKEEETEPLFFRRRVLFSNQLARFSSELTRQEVCLCLKGIEREAGRKAEEKQREIVRLDIDLLACDGQVCRPDDWARDYVRRGLSELDRL